MKMIVAGIAVAVLTVLAGCGTSTESSTETTPSTAAPEAAAAITHVHAVARDPKTQELLLATHEGLFRQGPDGEGVVVSPVIDLMSFAVAPDGTFFASGHPGTGSDLPEPVGLITSTDGGTTWRVVSRGGESDFHALSVGGGAIFGFDGAFRVSTDAGSTWTDRRLPKSTTDLAADPANGVLLAPTQDGLRRSTDQGKSWQPIDTPEALQLVAWADGTRVLGVSQSGHLASSTDAGLTWKLSATQVAIASAPVSDIAAVIDSDGSVEGLVVAGNTVASVRPDGADPQVLVQFQEHE